MPIGTAVLVGAVLAAGSRKARVNTDQSSRSMDGSMDGATHMKPRKRMTLLTARCRFIMFSSGSVVLPRYAMP